MGLDSGLLHMIAKGAQPRIAEAAHRGRMQGLEYRNSLSEYMNNKADRESEQRITNALATGVYGDVLQAGAGSNHLSTLMQIALGQDRQQNAQADRDFRNRSLDATTDYRNQSLDIARGRLAQTRRQQDPNREYAAREQAALQFGLQPDTPEYQSYILTGKIPKPTEGDGFGNPPAGYRFRPDGSLSAIPGGPATKQSAETSARTALAATQLQALDDNVIKFVEDGGLTGLWDYSVASLGRGKPGSIMREINAASEAMVRMLTGAGMNRDEAVREVQLYIPTIKDDGPAAANKLKQLKRRLRATIDAAGVGRGGGDAIIRNVTGQGPDGAGEWQDAGNGVRIRRVGGANQSAAPAAPAQPFAAAQPAIPYRQ